MSEMIERVARAYEDERAKWRQSFNAHVHPIMVSITRDGILVGIVTSLPDFEREGYKEFERMRDQASARAAIEAMREPTDDMVLVGARLLGDEPPSQNDMATVREIWDDAVRSALS